MFYGKISAVAFGLFIFPRVYQNKLQSASAQNIVSDNTGQCIAETVCLGICQRGAGGLSRFRYSSSCSVRPKLCLSPPLRGCATINATAKPPARQPSGARLISWSRRTECAALFIPLTNLLFYKMPAMITVTHGLGKWPALSPITRYGGASVPKRAGD